VGGENSVLLIETTQLLLGSRLIDTVVVYSPAAESKTISIAARRARRGTYGKWGGIVKVAGYTTLDSTLPSYLPECHINPRIC